MSLRFYEKIGKITIEQNRSKEKMRYIVDVWSGNCLAVFNYEYKDEETGQDMIQLYAFFNDEQHVKRMLKEYGNLFGDKVISAELNLYYKQNETLLKYFVRQGIKVKCYYKDPNEKKSKKSPKK